jgi:hypothetical protein
MQTSTNRSVVIISGLATLLVLSGAAVALGFHNGWLRTGPGAATPGAVSADLQPGDANITAPAAAEPPLVDSTPAATRDETSVYRQKLEEAYRALDDAYAQIRVLQAPQMSLASGAVRDERFADHDGDDARRERQSHRDSDDD